MGTATKITLENESLSSKTKPENPPQKPPRDPEIVKASSPVESGSKLQNETKNSTPAEELSPKVDPVVNETLVEPIQPEIVAVSPMKEAAKLDDSKVEIRGSTLPSEVLAEVSPKKETKILDNIEVEMVSLPKAEAMIEKDPKSSMPTTAQAEKKEARKKDEVVQEEPEEPEEEEETRFDPKGKSISTGRNITGWI